MDKLKKFLYPHPVLVVLLTILSGAGLGWIFLTGRETSWIAYPIYVLSFYALTVLCLWLVPVVIREAKKPKKVKTREEKERAFRKSLISGLVMNLVYALFHLLMGYVSKSIWTGSQGAYQLVMALIHLVLLHYDHKMRKEEDPRRQQAVGWNGFRACGVWLLILHLTMTGLVFQMVWNGETENDNQIVVIGVAAYTFYKLVMAVIRVVQYKKNASPLWGAARNIDLSEALMNLFTLQASLLSAFSTADQAGFRFLMNSLFGGVVCLMMVGGAIGMAAHGKKRKNEIIGEV